MEGKCGLSEHNSSLQSDWEVDGGGTVGVGGKKMEVFNTDGHTNAPPFLKVLLALSMLPPPSLTMVPFSFLSSHVTLHIHTFIFCFP